MTTPAPDPSERLLRAAVAELAAAERSQVVPDSVASAVMRAVWADLRRARMLALPDVSGPAFVAHHVVTALLDRVLAPITSIRLYSVALQPPDTVDAGAAPTVRLAIAVRYSEAVVQTVRRVRDAVMHVVDEQFGWTVQAVDIDVVDVFTTGEH